MFFLRLSYTKTTCSNGPAMTWPKIVSQKYFDLNIGLPCFTLYTNRDKVDSMFLYQIDQNALKFGNKLFPAIFTLIFLPWKFKKKNSTEH